jgi:hypothetical protein
MRIYVRGLVVPVGHLGQICEFGRILSEGSVRADHCRARRDLEQLTSFIGIIPGFCLSL